MRKALLLIHRGGVHTPGAIRGTEAGVLAFLRNLDQSRFAPIVLCNSDKHADAFRATGAEAHLFNAPVIMMERNHWDLPIWRYLRAVRRLDRLAREAEIAAIYRSGEAPCQVAIPVAKRHRIPTILHFHHPAPKRYHRFWLTKYADRVIFPSRYTREQSIGAVGLDGTVALNGIDCRTTYTPAVTRDTRFRSNHAIDDSDIVVGQVGAFAENKRHDLLIEGFRIASQHVSRPKLVLIGDGPERPRVERLVADAGLTERVVFAGYAPPRRGLFPACSRHQCACIR
jgi:glycosyltransferase involved in cell wall biosynthesis